jgi:hypothetical protein
MPRFDKQVVIWGSNINPSRLDFLFVNCMGDWQGANPIQDLGQHTWIRWGNMPNNENSTWKIGGELSHKLFEGFHPSRRCSNDDDIRLYHLSFFTKRDYFAQLLVFSESRTYLHTQVQSFVNDKNSRSYLLLLSSSSLTKLALV